MIKGKFQDIYGFQLTGQLACHDIALYYRLNLSNNNYWEDYDINLQSYLIRAFIVGCESTIAIYDIDMISVRHEIHSQTEKEKSSSSSYFKSFYNFYAAAVGSSPSSSSTSTTSSITSDDPNNRIKQWNRSRCVTLSPTLQFFDQKRRIIRLSIDPFHTLIATADSLGRVQLYDINSDCFIRLWKGIRDASLGWHIDEEDTTALFSPLPNPSSSHPSSTVATPAPEYRSSPAGKQRSNHNESNNNDSNGFALNENRMSEIAKTALQLVIFAPLLGLVSLYKMKNGPCLRVIPVGMNCKLVPIISSFIQNDRSIQTILPIACDSDSRYFSIITLNSKFQTETELSFLADLIDSLDIDEKGRSSDQDLVTMETITGGGGGKGTDGIPGGSKSPLASSMDPDYSIRHSDMRASMKEAMERGRKIRQPTHFLNNELQKYLFLLSGKTSLYGGGGVTTTITSTMMNKLGIQEIEKIENKILLFLKSQKSLFLLINMLSIIENFELNGFDWNDDTNSPILMNPLIAPPPPLAATSSIPFSSASSTGASAPVTDPTASTTDSSSGEFPWIRINTRNKRRFSIEFHKSITTIVKEKLVEEEASLKKDNLALYRRINDEIDIRTKLLSAFIHLSEIDSGSSNNYHTVSNEGRNRNSFGHSMDVNNSNSNSMTAPTFASLKEDASLACKANSFRSESLCWALRALKKLENKQKGMGRLSPSAPVNLLDLQNKGNNSGNNAGIAEHPHSMISNSMLSNPRLSLSPKPPSLLAAVSPASTSHHLPLSHHRNSSLSSTTGASSSPSGSMYESPSTSRHSSFTNSTYRRSSFSLTPPNLGSSLLSDITLRKLIENNTRNSFTSPTVDVLVSPQVCNDSFIGNTPASVGRIQGGLATPGVGVSTSSSAAASSASFNIESAILNFSIFRSLHI
jgi:hypothetical protein